VTCDFASWGRLDSNQRPTDYEPKLRREASGQEDTNAADIPRTRCRLPVGTRLGRVDEIALMT
jgi:hypothetical protein